MSKRSDKDDFWKIINEECVVVPKHLKHIMSLQNCNSFVVMSRLEETSFARIESFVQSTQFKDTVPENARFQDYYGTNTPNDKPEEFQFSEGDKIIVTLMRDFSKQHLLKKSGKCELPNKNESATPTKYVTSSGDVSTLLCMLHRSATLNSNRTIQGFRYSLSMKHMTAFIYILGGPILYKTLSHNFSIPSVTTVRRFVHDSGSIKEGSCRSLELKKFLIDRKLPLNIWLSEDATRLTNRVQYDPMSNQLVGFVLPLDENSMPIINSFTANSAKNIEDHFKNGSISSLLYVYIAQPLAKNAPYFCICLFGTDNKFNAMNVIQRWTYIKNSLETEGIKVTGCSGDGDPRILKAMRCRSQLGLQRHNDTTLNGEPIRFDEFHSTMLPELVFVQDPVHGGTKLRSRILASSRILPMGAYGVSISHLKILMKKLSRDKHCLTETDVNPQDKMNFPSVMRLSNPRVVRLLREHVPDSNATQIYLQIMLYSTSAFLSTSLSAVERIYCSWYTVFFLRIWRSYLNESCNYSATENFISSNTYMCLEMNAHGLLNIVLQCLESNSFDTFLPWLYGSQPCESFFRTYRSMSTVFLTVTASTLLESLQKLNKIQLLNDVINYNFEGETINFPIKKFLNASFEAQSFEIDLPSLNNISKNNSDLNIDIIKTVLTQAKRDAFESSTMLGMGVSESVANECKIVRLEDILSTDEIDVDDEDGDMHNNYNNNENDYEFEDEIAPDSVEEDDIGLRMSNENGVELKHYPNVNIETLKSDSPFTVVKDKEGNDIVVRKSAICWMLNKSYKLSSDRLQRVQDREILKNANINGDTIIQPQKCELINIGDWCLFEQDNGKCLIGCILSFAYFEEKTSGRIAYSSEYAKVEGNAKNIGVFCNWYECNGNKLISLGKMYVHGYYDISFYRMTIPAPEYDGQHCLLHNDVYHTIKSLL